MFLRVFPESRVFEAPSYQDLLGVFASTPAASINVPNQKRTIDPALSRRLRAHDQVDVAVQHLQQGQQLVDRFPVVGLIEQPV
jgi:hypothetical protein